MPQSQGSPEKSFSPTDLSASQQEQLTFVISRIEELKQARKEQYNGSIEKIWSDADRDYIPHRLKTRGKKAVVTDEDKGWRGQLVDLGSSNWQSDVAQPNPFVKIQIALSILIDQNPEGVFSPGSKKFQATTELMRQLYKRSWELARSKGQLKLFVFNLAKYGWACARSYPLRIVRQVKNIVKFNQDDPDKSVYEDKEVVEFNDVFRENLDPWNVWIDDTARPDDVFTVRDWCWRKVYALDSFKEEFGNWKLADKVQPGGITTDHITGNTLQTNEKKFSEKKLVEVYFYENRLKDLFVVIANDVPVVIAPLPISDAKGLKKLSLWQTYWNLRSANCPLGIGIYEAMRYDNAIKDRIRNMTIDQLTLSIYKMFFYQGTQALTETGDIKITPGIGKQTLDPKNINWLNVPGPGVEAWKGLEVLGQDVDTASGITDPLLGVVTGKTAFEIAQAKEAALKRLKNPLENITTALDTEAYITVALIQLLYSIPETYEIADPALVDAYLHEVQSDPELYERDENGTFTARVFPEFPLNMDTNEEGNLIETKDTRFFRVKPRFLSWDGVITIKSQSILTPSKQVDKAQDLEMFNMLIPLLQPRPMPQPDGSVMDIGPQIYGKIAKEIVKDYDKDPKDILPESWLQEQPVQNQPAPQPLIIPAKGAGGPVQQPPQPGFSENPTPTAQQFVANPQVPHNPQSFGQRLLTKLTNPFK